MSRALWLVYVGMLLACASAAYGRLVGLLYSNQLFFIPLGGRLISSDFVGFYNAALVTWSCFGGTCNVYDPEVQSSSFRHVTSFLPEITKFVYVYYPPHLFAIICPLALFDLRTAWLSYCLLGLTFLLVGTRFLWLEAAVSTRTGSRWDDIGRAGVVILALIAAYPTWRSFRYGQISLLLFPAITGFWLLLRKRQNLAAGLITGLCAMKLQYAPAFVICGTILGRSQYLLGLVISIALLFLVTLLVPGWTSVMHFPDALNYAYTHEEVSAVAAYNMQNFRGAMILLIGTDSQLVQFLSIFGFTLAMTAIGWLWLRHYPILQSKHPRAFELCATVTMILALMFSLHTHEHDYLLIAIPCFFLWCYHCSSVLDSVRLTWYDRIARVAILTAPFATWLCYLWWTSVFIPARVQPFLALAFLFLGLALVQIWALSRARPPGP